MITPKIIKSRSKSNDMKNINSSKSFKSPQLDISESDSSNSLETNKILKLLKVDSLKKINISRINNRITEPDKLIFSNIRLRNLQILSNDSSLNRLGKSTLDVNKIFGKINLKKIPEKEEIKRVSNEKLILFKNEYILKFARNAEIFNNFEKNSDLISDNKIDNFKDIFMKIKRILKNQANLFFDNLNIKNNIEEDSKQDKNDIKSGFYKYKSSKKYILPKIFKTLPNEEPNELENSNIENSRIDSTLNIKNKETIITGWYQLCSLMNKFIFLIFSELKDSKDNIRKLNQKLKDYEVRLDNNKKEIENMKSFLNKYEVNSKIFLKIKNEKEIEKIKSTFNKKENEYILSNYKLKSEIKNLTSLLDENMKYYNNCKELEKEIELGKKKNEDLKSFYNQELHEKNMENIIKSEKEDELLEKIKELENIIEGLQNDKDEYKKKEVENEIKIRNLYMNIQEKNENIAMQNEEVEWFLREYQKLNSLYLDTKKDLRNIENALLTKMKDKENKKDENESGPLKKKSSEINEKDKDKSDNENSFLEDMFQME